MTTPPGFAFARMPEVHFGAGKLSLLPQMVCHYGQTILLVTGAKSFSASARFSTLMDSLASAQIRVHPVTASGEPSPALIDQTVDRFRNEHIDCVVAIGGGSVMDSGKAISAMLPQEGSVTSFLEGMETRKHDGRKTPYIAVPTSSGTGSEATKNAVLSEIGHGGYKSSLRHDTLVPDIALIDPELMLSCPPDVTAACGLDALTQLLEAYVSSKSSPMTDALALSGLEHIAAGLIPAYERGDSSVEARAHMAYAAFLSGVVLANAGLGVVHGFAGPIGGFFPMPHGVVCGTLIGAATRINVDAMRLDPQKYADTLQKYARAGALLSGNPASTVDAGCEQLIGTLERWIETTRVARLSAYGVTRADFPRILDKSNNKNSPITLDRGHMQAILEARL